MELEIVNFLFLFHELSAYFFNTLRRCGSMQQIHGTSILQNI